MRTAIESEYQRQRMIGIADALRLLLGMRSDQVTTAVNAITQRYPEASRFIPVGSRDGEQPPASQAEIAYRDNGVVFYWRPDNCGPADCEWLVPR